MSKVILHNVNPANSNTTNATAINDNNETIEAAFDNTLSRDGTSPNQMGANFDMNSYQILNLPYPATNNSPLRLQDLADFTESGTVSGLPAGGTTGQPLAKTSNTDYSVEWASITGTGNFVKSTSPTLVTPALGTPSAINLANASNLSLDAIPSLGSNTKTFLTSPTSATLAGAISDETGTGSLVFATSPTLVSPALGTPSSGNLVNCTGATVAVGSITGLGTGVSTFLATPSSANLASAVTGETGSGALVFGTAPAISNPTITGGGSWAGSPTITTPSIIGVTNASSASAGAVGEYVSASVASGSAVALTTGGPLTVTSISLTAGDWDVGGCVFFNPAATTSITRYGGSIELTTNTFSTDPAKSWVITQAAFVPTANNFIGFPCPIYRHNSSSTTTIYLTAVAVFTTSTLGAYGHIWARRVR